MTARNDDGGCSPHLRVVAARGTPTGRWVSPTTSTTPSFLSSAADRTTSSWRCTRSCGASTAPTSRRGSTSSACPPRRRGCSSARARTPAWSTSATGIAVAIRIESHNHPSAIEPYQGAATGVGGILRDIFTMGARPIAVMDPLRFGPLDDARQPLDRRGGRQRACRATATPSACRPSAARLSSTRPTPATRSSTCSASACCPPSGSCSAGRRAWATSRCCSAPRTGRDGIGGVSVLASAGFSDDEADAAKRPSVQVGDPFEEKRLIEACLELLDAGLVVGIQDLGGAGLACATSETAAAAASGMDVDVTAVPCREPGMEPFEVMTSESQERMLAIVDARRPRRGRWRSAARWEVAGHGRRHGSPRPGPDGVGRLRIARPAGRRGAGRRARGIARTTDAPLYDRRAAARRPRAAARRRPGAGSRPRPTAGADLLGLLVRPLWVSVQYDHQLFLNTVAGPAGDAAVLRLRHPVTGVDTGRGLAPHHRRQPRLVRESTPRAGPRPDRGRVGAEPGLRRRPPARRRQLPELRQPRAPRGDVAAVRGHRRHVRGLPGARGPGGRRQRQPLQRVGRRATSTPPRWSASLGLVDELAARPPAISWRTGDRLVLLGSHDGTLAGSRWARTLRGCTGGELAPLDLAAHRRLCELVRELVSAELAAPAGDGTGAAPGLVHGIHDVSDGGLAVALAELAIGSGVGCRVEGVASHCELFSEAPSRVVVATSRPNRAPRHAPTRPP